MMTEWKIIEGYNDYEVSDDGQVRSFKHGKTRILKQSSDRDGYQKISLCKDGESKTCRVHRLVIETFIGLCPEGKECNHIDGNKSNQSVENLEWITSSENQLHALKTGLKIDSCGNGTISKKPVNQFTKKGRFITGYKSQYEAARKTGVRRSDISKCCRGIYKTVGGFVWKFEKDK